MCYDNYQSNNINQTETTVLTQVIFVNPFYRLSYEKSVAHAKQTSMSFNI